MPVFISYSHADAEFATALAGNLFKAKTPVWVDQFELNVGDSLIRRIEDAITKATAFIFVLSKASVESEWCRKELTAGLVRELEEKKVLVLPVLLEDCQIPLFLREKKYADFRKDFDAGLQEIINALARVTTHTQARLEAANVHTDWATDWTTDSKQIVTVELVAVEQWNEHPFTTLSCVRIKLNESASQRHLELARADFEPFARQLVLEVLADTPLCDDLFVVLEDASPVKRELGLRDPKAGFEFRIRVECRRLGTDTGKDLVINVGSQIRGMAIQGRKALERPPDPRRAERLRQIMVKYRPDAPRARD